MAGVRRRNVRFIYTIWRSGPKRGHFWRMHGRIHCVCFLSSTNITYDLHVNEGGRDKRVRIVGGIQRCPSGRDMGQIKTWVVHAQCAKAMGTFYGAVARSTAMGFECQ